MKENAKKKKKKMSRISVTDWDKKSSLKKKLYKI